MSSGWVRPTLRHALITGVDVPSWIARHPRRAYVVQAVLATPDWVDRAALQELRRQAKYLSCVTGRQHVLDHIIPLNHPDVSGLNVPWNIQILTRLQNAYKSNKWNPYQLMLL